MNHSEQINELAAALSKMQAQLTPAIKDSNNPFFKSKYADLTSVWESCRTPLTNNGLSVTQTMDYQNDKTMLVTTLMHTSGQWIKSVLPIIWGKGSGNEAQAFGAGISYMRRYALSSILGIVQDDDDGNSAFPNKPQTISKFHAQELQSLLNECDEKFRAQVISWMSNPAIGAKTIFELPAANFEPLRNDLLKHIQNRKQAHV